MTTTQEKTVPTEQKFYNPLIVKLETLEVKDKTVENYLSQIKNNFYCSVKAHYLIARDLYDAQQNLKDNQYSRLIQALNFSGATQSKYLAIGRDVRLMKVFLQGKLPMKWTTQYLLTQLTDEQFKKVVPKLDAETSAKDIKKVADYKVEQEEKLRNDLISFLNLQIDKSEFKGGQLTFQDLVNKIKSALSKFPEIIIQDDRVETAKKSISAYQNKMRNEEEKKDNIKKKVEKALAVLNQAKELGVEVTA